MKKAMLIIGILAVAGAGIGYKIYNKPHKDIKSAKADISLNAAELFSAYEQDENAANTKFLDKTVQITGTVQEVKKDDDGNMGITLDGGGMMFGVTCKLDPLSEHKRTKFEVGETVTFKGICTGMLMDVVIERCVEM